MPSSQFIIPEQITDESIPMLLEDTYTRFQSVEQARWNESNIDSRFWAGDQDYIYQYFNFSPNYGAKKFFFNIIQQPCNMVTGYQRQHRKNFNVMPVEFSDQKTADQFNKILTFAQNKRYLSEKFSVACEQSMTTGMCLVQPFLNYSEDPINGDIDWNVWEFNSFMMDPYFRNADMSDANFVWCQKYLSRKEAQLLFPEHSETIKNMPGYSGRDGRFYFLPENYNIARTELLILSYYWYKTTARRKRLLNQDTGETTEFFDTEENIKSYVEVFPQFQVIEIDVPVWKVATVLNQNVLYHGDNPSGFDECPFVPIFWNYDPYIAQPGLRVRSLVRSLRDINYLFNRRLIINHDISESSINSGWLLQEDSVVNEENLKFSGQGKDLYIKDGVPRENWPQKIIPNAVPPSDLQLADQLFQLIYPVSGVNQELMGAAQDTDTGITTMLRQGAGLITLQKYFDQWDMSLKLLGMINMRIIQRNWKVFKISRILGEEPTEQFFTKNFQKYDVLPVEGLNTTIQQQQQFVQLLQFQQLTGIKIPPAELLKASTFQGKDDLIKALEAQQQQEGEMMQQQRQLEMAAIEGKLENMKASSAEKLALARERTGRTKSNIGLFDERISEMTQNRARALKEKIGALNELLATINAYGEIETQAGMQVLGSMEQMQKQEEAVEKSVDEYSENQKNANLGLHGNRVQQPAGAGQQSGISGMEKFLL